MVRPPTAPTVPTGARDVDDLVGSQLGRYVLMGELGRGGMGRVFAAFDPELGRRVAIKVIEGGDELGPYLLGEARALATLSHPNIVPVFDVGVEDRRLYLVMELIDGMTLWDWLRAQPRVWKEIVAAFAEAGRGLAAAHAARVVHRDFKATNVLVGKDGRARVADFGLARAPDDGRSRNEIAGTEEYMAPEVLDRGAVTDAVDQYAFSVALAKALDGIAAPLKVSRIVDRGRAEQPSARWPSLSVMVDELDRTVRGPRTRQVMLAIAGVTIGAVAAGWLVPGHASVNRCELGIATASRAITPALRSRLTAVLQDTATVNLDRITSASLDSGIATWATVHDAACESPARLACLDASLEDLVTIIDDAVIERDRAAVEVPVAIAHWRDELASCDSPERHPGGSATYRHAMARSLAQFRQGRTKEARAAAEVAIGSATDPHDWVRANMRRVMVDDASAVPTDSMFEAARGTGDPLLGAEVAFTAAQRCLDGELATCAQVWLDRSAAGLADAPASSASFMLRANLAGLRGELALRAGQPEVAAAMFEDEARRKQTLRGSSSFELIAAWTSLAGAQIQLHRYGEAIASAKRADELAVHWVGADHPYRAAALATLGAARLKQGDRERGIADLEHALALRVDLEGEVSPRLISTYNNLAAAYQATGKPEQALALLDKALACYALAPNASRGNALIAMRNAALLASLLGRSDARTRIAKAIALADQALAAAHPEHASLLRVRAVVQLRLGELSAAEDDLLAALRRYGEAAKDLELERAITHGYLAMVGLLRHRYADAHRELSEANRLASGVPDASPKRLWLDELAIELAMATDRGGGVEPQLAQLRARIDAAPGLGDPELLATFHAIAATFARSQHDTSQSALESEATRQVLGSARVPLATILADCAVCDPAALR